MSSLLIGLIILVMLLGLLAMGTPIAFTLGLVSLASIVFFLDPSQLNRFGDYVFGELNSFTLLAVPLFIFMGEVFGGSRASKSLFEVGQMWLGKLRGGLAMSSIVGSGIFAALCGASAATAAAIGRVAIPEMKRYGYSDRVATGAVVAGGTLGILIPPSVTLILYGIVTEESIGQLFMAGVIPGIIVVLLFCIWISIAVSLEQRRGLTTAQGLVQASGNSDQMRGGETTMGVEDYPWKDRFKALIKVFPFIALIAGVLGSLYLGFATPSEAAAIGAFLAVVMVVVGYGMDWKRFVDITVEATGTTTMTLMIVAFSGVLGTVLSFIGIPQDLAQLITNLEVNRWLVLLIINILLLILGFFLPPVSIIVMVMPILLPIITALEFDPIWFGIVMTLNMEMGLITPPVGINLYIVKGIAPEISLRDILIGALPYTVVLALAIVLFSFFPGLVTWLPNRLFG
jgi:C4-dicarboxylate transporter DctM subunit